MRSLVQAIVIGLLSTSVLAACGDDDAPKPAAPIDAGEEAAAPDAGTPVIDAGRDAGQPPGRIDRAGRFIIIRTLVEPEYRDEYNQAASFADHSLASWEPSVARGLAAYDAIDGVTDWPETPHPLKETLLADALLLDTSKASCTASPVDCASYLDLETADIGANTTFGGRTPNDDVADATLTLLAKGKAAYLAACSTDRAQCSVNDGVSSPAARRATNVFPYLVE